MNFIKRSPIIIIIAGRAESGKSTLANYLKDEYEAMNKKIVISPFAKYLKKYIEEITGEDINEKNKPRDLLQQISSKIIKGDMKKNNFFIDRQIDDIEIYSYFFDIVLIPDTRFPDEIELIKSKFKNVISIGISRGDYVSLLTQEQRNDVTETALDFYDKYDIKIKNIKNTDLKSIAKGLSIKILEGGFFNE